MLALAACGLEPAACWCRWKSPHAVALYLACLRLGLVYVPLNTAYTDEEVGYFVGDAEPRVLVCRPADEDRLSAGRARPRAHPG
ncbi:MAG: AMP-binding protein [Pseudomonadales bacterium]